MRRSSPRHPSRVVVAYEADSIDPVHHLGWSVVVTGRARLVADPELLESFQQRLRPWIAEPAMAHVIRIEAELVTGFHLTPIAGPSPPLGNS